MRRFFLLMLLSVSCSCVSQRSASSVPDSDRPAKSLLSTEPTVLAWRGIYASPSEVGGYSSTVLELAWGHDDMYRMRSRSDMRQSDVIVQDEVTGTFLRELHTLYIPVASGRTNNGETQLSASIDRYTMAQINGRAVLMRDDAYAVYQKEGKLYDYGILIKVSDEPGLLTDLKKVEHPSIKLLYANPNGPWADPFVNGPNSR
jgi:hypothetical protein